MLFPVPDHASASIQSSETKWRRDAVQSNIIHGDIKPQNILVFRNTDRTIAKVADFRYSTIVAGDSGTIRLPKSRPWNAPEHHFGSFTFTEARKTDVYSFGLLCIWILFGKTKLVDSTIEPAVTTEFITFSLPPDRHTTPGIEELRDQGTLMDAVYQMIRKTPGLEEAAASLEQFFKLALEPNNTTRTADIDGLLLPLLRPQKNRLLPPALKARGTSSLRGIMRSSDLEYRLVSDLIELIRTDYLVRKHIRQCLEERYHLTKSSSIAFQLTLCYKIGFGVKSDEAMSNIWLQLSSRSLADIGKERDSVVAEKPARKKRMETLFESGLLDMIQLVAGYQLLGSERFNEAYDEHLREFHDMAEYFGDKHIISVYLRSVMHDFLVARGEYSKAEELSTEAMEIAKSLNDSDFLTCMDNLETIYGATGRWSAAEELGVRILEMKRQILGEEHPFTLISMTNLASTYVHQGKLEEARKLQEHVVAQKTKVFGNDNPATLTSIAWLASIYKRTGQWNEAEELQLQVSERLKGVLDEEHPYTLASIINLASTYQVQGRLSEAKALQSDVRERRKKVLGRNDPNGLSSMASLYNAQGRWAEAEELGIQVLEMRKKMHGEEHPFTLLSMTNLASTYVHQGRLDEARKLQEFVVERNKEVFGDDNPDTLGSMAFLALTYLYQGQETEAIRLQKHVMQMRIKALGLEHPDSLASIANFLTCTRNWRNDSEQETEIHKAYLQVTEKLKTILGQEHPDTLQGMANIAETYRAQERLTEAEELQIQMMELRKKVLGQEHPDTLTSMVALARTYYRQWKFDEAEELEAKVREMRKKTLGQEHPDTLASMADVTYI